ncbi:MAG: ketopantoate reductase family protein [Synergistaceae bacterium]|jgi:2-dehydropantoate 2-reductase|nr:ketopantoate reductase family protein [Synergistaceae bacterium]
MKKYAVVGMGAIGSLIGGYLTKAGLDVTLISAFRREQAEFLRVNGLTISGIEGQGEEFHVSVKSTFLGDLASDTMFDVIFLTLKSNDLLTVVTALRPHLSSDGFLVTTQNGISEETLIPIVGKKRVIAGSTFAGGVLIAPGHMASHDGHFYVGELDCSMTERLNELASVLSNVRPAFTTTEIRSYQWDKLARVCLSVPVACISGLFLGSVFTEIRLMRLFAALALELFAVAEADGYERRTVEERTKEQWLDIIEGRKTGLEDYKGVPWPDGIIDAYTMDIQKGRPLEIDHTNGAVIRLGKKYGVPTPVNERLVECVRAVEKGKATPGFHLVDVVLC